VLSFTAIGVFKKLKYYVEEYQAAANSRLSVQTQVVSALTSQVLFTLFVIAVVENQ